MLTNRKLKDRIKELEGQSKEYLHNLRKYEQWLFDIAHLSGVKLQHVAGTSDINCCVLESVSISALKGRIVELKDKAEKADDHECKPCPYCKSLNISVKDAGEWYWVDCLLCEMNGPRFKNRRDTVEAWNNLPRRTTA